MGRIGLVVGITAIAAIAAPAGFQPLAQMALGFEVASVKPSNGPPTRRYDIALGCHGTDNRNNTSNVPNNRCLARFATLRMLIALAYDIPLEQGSKIAGGPDWSGSLLDTFEIEAKSEQPATQAELRQMLQNLLADRFKLTFHHVQRDMNGYALLVSKNGAKLSESSPDLHCSERARHEHSYDLAPAVGAPDQCHSLGGGPTGLIGRGMDMSDLAEFLSGMIGETVIDKTNLRGVFDFKTTAFAKQTRTLDTGTDSTNLDALPSLPTVLEEQLGLRLEKQKVPVDIIVIDHAEKPIEN